MSNITQNEDSLVEKLKATDSNSSDIIYNGFKAVASSIPALGPLAEFFIDTYIGPPTTKRIRNFLETVVEKLTELQSKVESVNCENPVFLTTFLHASQIARHTHKEQKLEALRNVVLNSSIPSSVEDDVLAIFLNWIDGFTALHISTLKHLHYLDKYAIKELDTYFPMLEQNRAIYNQVLKDLADRGLINLRENYVTKEDADGDIALQRLGISRYSTPLGANHISQRRGGKERELKTVRRQEDIDKLLKMNRLYGQESKTTELGKQFMEFIEYPSIQTELM
ncbi:hypothetical protein [Microcoleus sp. D3_18_C4]|uniref:hypothetical protein n=1 Tax=Microcoleus sp. D3_18_C4 TaxID=3055335 RepID=UPI002FD3ADFF